MYRYLSHILNNEIPVYGGSASLDICPVKSMSKGDPVNVFKFSMENHWGTHVDCPAHFFKEGKKVVDYLPDAWHFKHPQIIDINLKPSELLVCDDWVRGIRPDSDILLFHSNWGELRGHALYSNDNPGIHPEVGNYLRSKHPCIRAIGIDWISISPFKNKELGIEAHQSFLKPDNPILVIEDMDLSCEFSKLKEVWVIPLRVDGLDGAPCTVIGVFDES